MKRTKEALKHLVEIFQSSDVIEMGYIILMSPVLFLVWVTGTIPRVLFDLFDMAKETMYKYRKKQEHVP